MRIAAADDHAVLFDEAEAGRRFARACEDVFVARSTELIEQAF